MRGRPHGRRGPAPQRGGRDDVPMRQAPDGGALDETWRAPAHAVRFITAIALLIALSPALIAAAPAAERKSEDNVRVTPEQMRQLTLAKVELQSFRAEKAAV